ncbi:MAG: hypothetical protein LRY41_00625 [Candidatus Pacebacteria bacterium]|nr:hypothetical protein [Candidatus Paceibacterota bacterium]MCD8507858.1 hypothetical protein [Candidatus Paceibacterota bacterium]MCD8527831.1 hypothetical protein [Candidatus Paceibacterota bacterium]MCD8563537.1 hypothetical protein [Candidatus Paceibacterota bacterium]
MLYEHLPRIIEIIGSLLLAFMVLRVHHRILHEHKIDRAVFKVMKLEQKMGILGFILVITGFLLSLI